MAKADQDTVKPHPVQTERVAVALFDIKSGKPGCVLLQAIYGGDRSVCLLFTDWETAPTKSMKMIRGTMVEWQCAADLYHKRKSRRAA